MKWKDVFVIRMCVVVSLVVSLISIISIANRFDGCWILLCKCTNSGGNSNRSWRIRNWRRYCDGSLCCMRSGWILIIAVCIVISFIFCKIVICRVLIRNSSWWWRYWCVIIVKRLSSTIYRVLFCLRRNSFCYWYSYCVLAYYLIINVR